jgi:hypothetical protein
LFFELRGTESMTRAIGASILDTEGPGAKIRTTNSMVPTRDDDAVEEPSDAQMDEADGGEVSEEDARPPQERPPDSSATVKLDLAALMASAGVALPSRGGMEVSVSLESGAAEAVSVEALATKQIDIATLMNLGGIDPEISVLAGTIVSNAATGDESMNITIREDLQTLVHGVQQYISSERSQGLDTETRLALTEFAQELASALASEALTGQEESVDDLLPEDDEPTIRGAIPVDALLEMDEPVPDSPDPMDEMATLQFESPFMAAPPSVSGEAGQLRRMTPESDTPKVPEGAAAPPLREQPDDGPVTAQERGFSDMPAPVPSGAGGESGRGRGVYIATSLVLMILILCLAAVAVFLLWDRGHVADFVEWAGAFLVS